MESPLRLARPSYKSRAFRSEGGLVFFLLLCLAGYALADTGLFEQRVRVSFQPTGSFLLLSTEPGSVRSFDSAIVEGSGEYLVGAPLKELGALATFFIRGKDALFAATPVRRVSEVDRRSREDIATSVQELERERLDIERVIGFSEIKLRELRLRAMQIAGVDELIKLQTELNRLQTADKNRQAEEDRLKQLVKIARSQKDPEGIDLLRQSLSENLRDTAQATALAERLKSRKKRSALESFQEKMALIKEMSQYSREELAREILTLRARRRELERALGR